MCGEKSIETDRQEWGLGSPPHVRGKAHALKERPFPVGITPACAGKSLSCGDARSQDWDHPRMCGEKVRFTWHSSWSEGSPPHVRGKVLFWFVMLPQYRITPACAGKSMRTSTTHFLPWDHPRMCGEKTKKIP